MTRADIEREARRRWILNAARRLFEGKDLESCTMDDIADAADYTRRTLYSRLKLLGMADEDDERDHGENANRT